MPKHERPLTWTVLRLRYRCIDLGIDRGARTFHRVVHPIGRRQIKRAAEETDGRKKSSAMHEFYP